MITHRALDGSWAVCPDADACELLFHFPDQTPEAMAAMPFELLHPVLEIMDPPHEVRSGIKLWLNAMGQSHRDYDLPAIIHGNGLQQWCQAGTFHRVGDMPAVVCLNGRREWWWHGNMMVGQRRPGGPYAMLGGHDLMDKATRLVGRLAAADALDWATVGR